MTKWPSAKHFASWLGLSPNNRITGGKAISSRTKPSANRAAKALRLAAYSLHRSDSALGAFLRRKKAHLGAPKAITATAHKLARIIYSMLRYGQRYVDAGAEYYESQYRHRALRNAKRRAAQLGYELVPKSDDQDQPSSTLPAPIAGRHVKAQLLDRNPDSDSIGGHGAFVAETGGFRPFQPDCYKRFLLALVPVGGCKAPCIFEWVG